MAEQRTFRISMPVPTPQDERQAVRAYLSDNADVMDFTLDETALVINYQFPRTTRDILWQRIRKRIGAYRSTSLATLTYDLLAYMEANEQKHLLRYTGWQRYVQDIHIRHVHPGDQGTAKRKNWEQYRKSSSTRHGGKA